MENTSVGNLNKKTKSLLNSLLSEIPFVKKDLEAVVDSVLQHESLACNIITTFEDCRDSNDELLKIYPKLTVFMSSLEEDITILLSKLSQQSNFVTYDQKERETNDDIKSNSWSSSKKYMFVKLSCRCFIIQGEIKVITDDGSHRRGVILKTFLFRRHLR